MVLALVVADRRSCRGCAGIDRAAREPRPSGRRRSGYRRSPSRLIFEAADVRARSVGLNPKHAGARRQLAELLVLTGESRRALAEVAAAFELNARPHHVWFLAYLQAVNGNPEAPLDMVRPLAVEKNFPVDYQRLPDFDAMVAKIITVP